MKSSYLYAAALMLCAGTASAQSTWTNTAGGNWNVDTNWDTLSVPLAGGDSAILPNLGMPYDVLCNVSPQIDALTINGPTQQLLIQNSRTLRILTSAGVINEGTIVINDTGSVFNAHLTFADISGSSSLAGSGHVELNGGASDTGDAQIVVENGATLAIQQPVMGAGRIAIDTSGIVNNQNAITANINGSDLRIQGTLNQTPAATLQGSGGGLINTHAATIAGGQLLGGVEASGGSTYDGVTMSGTNGVRSSQTLNMAAGGITNNGTIDVNVGNTVFNSVFGASAPATIDGTGTIELTGSGGDQSDAQLTTVLGNSITVESAQTVSGNGRINANNAPITFRGIALGNLAGEDLSLEGTFDFDNTGRTQSAGGFVRLNNAEITSGLFQGSTDTAGTSTITDCTNSSTLRVRENGTLNMTSTLVNNGTIIVNHVGSVFNAAFTATADTAITGAGTISLNMGTDINDARLNVGAGITLDIGAGQTVDGAGKLESTGQTNMSGDYIANVAGKDLQLRGAHDLSTGGTAQGTGGGTVDFNQADVTGGTFNGGVHASGTATFMRGFVNNGSFGVRNNGTLTLDGPITNNDTITINPEGTVFNARVIATAPITIDGDIVLNGASDPGDAELRADETAAGSIDLPATSTVSGNGRLNGPIDARGTITPGADDLTAGTIQLQQDITLHSTSTVVLDFEETDSVVSFDKLTGNSTLSLDGTIELRLQGGYEPAIGDTFTIVDATTITGVFATTDTPLIGTHLFRVIENAGDVTALWTCLGDVNLDGMLTPTDFTAWINAFNTGDVEVGDQNLDGMLTPTDFTAWIINFNAGC